MIRSSLISATIMASAAAEADGVAADLRLIIDRQDTSIEVFAALDVHRMEGIFGVSPDGLAAEDGRVYYGAFRKTGTYDVASDIISGVSMQVGSQLAELDAMSVMVHPQTLILPYETPFDAVLAMAVCNVNDPITPPALQDLQLYSGFIAYPVEGYDPFVLNIPTTETITVDITTYADSEFSDTRTITLKPGEPIVFEAADTQGWFWHTGLARLLSD